MRFVVAVAEERNFTRAAERCHVSQPALSRQVKDVESVLGAKLFERRTRSVSITKAGHLFVREARRTLEQGHRTVSLVQAFAKQEECPIVIGLSALSDLPRVQTFIEQTKRTVRGLSFAIHTADTPELMQGLLRGEVDVAVVDLPTRERGVRCASLFTEPLVAVLPERLLSTKRPTMSLSVVELLKSPRALLAQSIDPGRAVIERHLSTLGTRAFRIHDANGAPIFSTKSLFING